MTDEEIGRIVRARHDVLTCMVGGRVPDAGTLALSRQPLPPDVKVTHTAIANPNNPELGAR